MEKLWKKVAMINILEMLPYEMIDVVPGELGAVLLGLGPLAVVLSLEPPEMLHKMLPQEMLTLIPMAYHT